MIEFLTEVYFPISWAGKLWEKTNEWIFYKYTQMILKTVLLSSHVAMAMAPSVPKLQGI